MQAQAKLNDAQVAEVFDALAEWLPADDESALVPRAKHDGDIFRALVGCLLSAQSKDENTARARTALFALADTPAAIAALSDDAIVQAIRPAGLYNLKTRNLRRLCEHLLARSEQPLPRDRAGLMALPGIGRKCADIVLRFTLGEEVVAVDTHVHRVCQRLGLAQAKTEAETARQLEPRIPPSARRHGHMRLLEFGKQICQARRPQCERCFLFKLCAAPEKRV